MTALATIKLVVESHAPVICWPALALPQGEYNLDLGPAPSRPKCPVWLGTCVQFAWNTHASLAKFSRSLVENRHFNGHPDLIVRGKYANNAVSSGLEGIEIKSTRKAGGAVDTHGARQQWMCVFVYEVDNATEPATDRRAMRLMASNGLESVRQRTLVDRWRDKTAVLT